jgi:hypothetical protein
LFFQGLSCGVDDSFESSPENSRKFLAREFFVICKLKGVRRMDDFILDRFKD